MAGFNMRSAASEPNLIFMPILPCSGISSFVINQILYTKSVNIVLLPVQGGVGLDDDVLMGVLFQFVDEHGLASL